MSLITLEVPASMMSRLIDALESLAHDYSDLHREELQRIRAPAPAPEKGRYFVQSDKALYDAEQKDKSELVEIV